MGSQASREQHQDQQHSHHHRRRHSFTRSENYHPSSAISYATMDRRIPLPTSTYDTPRVDAPEIQNLQRHNRTRYPSTSDISTSQGKSMKTPSPNNYAETKKPHVYQNTPKSTTNPTPNTTPKPKPKHGIRQSRSFNNLADTNVVVTAQQLIYDQAKIRQRNKSPSILSINSNLSSNLEKSTSSSSLSHLSTENKRKKIPDDFKFVSISPKYIQNAREIGQGQFGTVYRAVYKDTDDVAIKTLHCQDENRSPGESDSDYDEGMRELLYEAHIMTRLKHPNLLRIIGVTFFGDAQRLSIVTNFMKNGSLLDYLRKNRDGFTKSNPRLVTAKLNKYALQIFEAMAYLEERKIIHRDLAARNCLIGEGDTLKVGDFGLTTLTDCGLYKGTYSSICAPRWTSPEALHSAKFSSRSDVWSYGITLWEMYTLGERPFGNMNNLVIRTILKNSSENISQHLPKPRQFASDETYTHIILLCLTHNLAMRPRFKDLRERLVTILVDRS